MGTINKNIYNNRINLALDYINNNLNDKISIQELAKAAYFSPFHFHRLFTAYMNETVLKYINRVRMEKSTRLLSYTNKNILEIALDCGFSSLSTFSRSFKQYFDCTPSYFRKRGLPKNSKIRKNRSDVSDYIKDISNNVDVKVKRLDIEKIAFITVHNSFKEGKVLNALNIIIDWSKKMNVYDKGEILGMSLDDVMVTPKAKYRYLVGITIPKDFCFEHSEINAMSIPSSKYVTTKVNGSINDVIDSWNYLYNNWLFHSNYEPNDLHAIELFLDKDKANDWSHYNLELALPIKLLTSY